MHGKLEFHFPCFHLFVQLNKILTIRKIASLRLRINDFTSINNSDFMLKHKGLINIKSTRALIT